MSQVKLKLPKQLKYWMQKLGFKPESKHNQYYWISRQRRIRCVEGVDGKPDIQISEQHSTFDRWANSKLISGVAFLENEQAFIKRYTDLLNKATREVKYEYK